MKVNIGKDIELDVDVDKLNAAVMAHVVYIGLRNILMDAHASATKKDGATQDEARALSEKKLASMYAGEVRTVATRSGDPIAREMFRMATEIVKTAVRAAGRKLDSVDVPALAKKYVAKHEAALRPKAEASVAATRAESVNIEELGL